MRPIDADELKKDLGEVLINLMKSHETSRIEKVGFALDVVDEAETLDVAPVVHAKWKVVEVDATQTKFACSKCGRTIECGNDYFMKPTKHIGAIYPYCHCGSKMDGDEK